MNEQQEKRLNDIAQELALFQMNTLKRLGELNDLISHAVAGVKATSEALKVMEVRVKELEDARKMQIRLNSQFHVHDKASHPSRDAGFLWNFWKIK